MSDRFFIKEGVWPVSIAGNDKTFYILDRRLELSDSTNPEYFTLENVAIDRVCFLNKAEKELSYLCPQRPGDMVWGIYRRKKGNKRAAFRLDTCYLAWRKAVATAMAFIAEYPEYEYSVKGDYAASRLPNKYMP